MQHFEHDATAWINGGGRVLCRVGGVGAFDGTGHSPSGPGGTNGPKHHSSGTKAEGRIIRQGDPTNPSGPKRHIVPPLQRHAVPPAGGTGTGATDGANDGAAANKPSPTPAPRHATGGLRPV
ncbi:MAG: hypothetical protein JWM98_2669 [Thermoleophilia bacterium]|nr:hypothetical protein [Thermoleophilia bacterium]